MDLDRPVTMKALIFACLITGTATLALSVLASWGIAAKAKGELQKSQQELIRAIDEAVEVFRGATVSSVGGDVTINRGVDYEPLIRAQLERNNELLHPAGIE